MNSLLILMVTGLCFSVAYNKNTDANQWRTPVSDCGAPGENIADTDNMTVYYLCALQYPNGTWLVLPMACPPGSSFNTTFAQCLFDEEMTTTFGTTELTSVTEETTPIPTENGSEGTSPAVTGSTSVITNNPTNPSEGTSPAETGSPVVTNNPPIDCTPATDSNCTQEGRFADNTDCSGYFICIFSDAQWFRYRYTCASGHYYNPETSLCTPGLCPYTMNPCPTATTTMMTMVTSTQPSFTTTSVTTSTKPPTTSSTTAPIGYTCFSEGNFPDPYKCTQYYQCALINGLWYYFIYECPTGMYFNSVTNTCSAGVC